jgi:hypothetical protein
MFIKLLNKIYQSFCDNHTILTHLFFRVGEHVKFEGIKHSIFTIQISAESLNRKNVSELNFLAEESHLSLDIRESMVSINIPMITK